MAMARYSKRRRQQLGARGGPDLLKAQFAAVEAEGAASDAEMGEPTTQLK